MATVLRRGVNRMLRDRRMSSILHGDMTVGEACAGLDCWPATLKWVEKLEPLEVTGMGSLKVAAGGNAVGL